MENRFNNYALHRAAEVFKDVNLPPKVQEAFDLWKKVRRHVVTDVGEIVGGQCYVLRNAERGRTYHTHLIATNKAFMFHDKWCMRFRVLGEHPYDEDGEPNTVFLCLDLVYGKLYRSTGNCRRFLQLTQDMHPAQFYCVVTGEHYTQEFFNAFRELQL